MRIRRLAHADIGPLVAAFAAAMWPGKDAALYRRYLEEQASGDRLVLIAEQAREAEQAQAAQQTQEVAGYVCVVWRSAYEPFRDAGIPEIADFNVLPSHRRRGVGTALMDAAESVIAGRAPVAGLGCGLYADYGAALLLYLRRGYLPDGRGVVYDGKHVSPGGVVRLDDSAAMMFTKPLPRRPV